MRSQRRMTLGDLPSPIAGFGANPQALYPQGSAQGSARASGATGTDAAKRAWPIDRRSARVSRVKPCGIVPRAFPRSASHRRGIALPHHRPDRQSARFRRNRRADAPRRSSHRRARRVPPIRSGARAPRGMARTRRVRGVAPRSIAASMELIASGPRQLRHGSSCVLGSRYASWTRQPWADAGTRPSFVDESSISCRAAGRDRRSVVTSASAARRSTRGAARRPSTADSFAAMTARQRSGERDDLFVSVHPDGTIHELSGTR